MARNFLSQLTGSFAMPAAENPTVAMVEAAYRHHGLDWRYINCKVSPDRLGDAVIGARAMGWAGFNCSLPHKVAVIEHLDGLGESASIIGAVNTVVRRDDQLIGENTDGKGFVEAIGEMTDPGGKTALVFGAGGAARAICVELALVGVAHIAIANRDEARGGELARLVANETPAQTSYLAWRSTLAVPADTDFVINATSVGLFPDVDARLDVEVDSLQPHMLVVDCIPNPPMTRLLRDARERSCAILDGLGMLVNQGAIAIRHWTGIEADRAIMRRAVEDVLLDGRKSSC